ncbi:MAG: CopG family ribbon-helix-helix protein [Candidatus Thermoplasmatota archaeon]|nr:CopG family ribbon-helix-helix protein [Candidatus Thermoplasmatota archaeon]MBU1941038.1 CopG family ribbon-helix-helix protein [Candidatus Thermoplasmatota archaeon]
MPIISISLNDVILKEIDQLQNTQGYSGRSEIIRAGVRLLLSESKDLEKISGHINSLLFVIHNQEDEDTVSHIKHQFEDITTTQIHSHLDKHKCLEIFILQGDTKKIKEMIRQFQTSRKMDIVKLIIP